MMLCRNCMLRADKYNQAVTNTVNEAKNALQDLERRIRETPVDLEVSGCNNTQSTCTYIIRIGDDKGNTYEDMIVNKRDWPGSRVHLHLSVHLLHMQTNSLTCL